MAQTSAITPRDLRHTALSLVVSAGGNVLELARMLGHESPRMTPETFADLFGTDPDARGQMRPMREWLR